MAQEIRVYGNKEVLNASEIRVSHGILPNRIVLVKLSGKYATYRELMTVSVEKDIVTFYHHSYYAGCYFDIRDNDATKAFEDAMANFRERASAR